MRTLIVVATKKEAVPLLEHFNLTEEEGSFSTAKGDFQVLITGVGMVATAYSLGNKQINKYDLAINMGIAGSFDASNNLGDIVLVEEDRIFEIGAENDLKFLSPEEMGLNISHQFKNESKYPFPELDKLPVQKAITVNKVHGNMESINRVKKAYKPQVESMEGAAFMYACKKANIPHAQVRAISNYVEVRDKSKWKIDLAINNLNQFIIKCIE